MRFLMALLITVFSSSLAPAKGDDWKARNEAGRTATAEGRLADAEREFKAAIELSKAFPLADGRRASSCLNLARIYLAQGRQAAAEGPLDCALETLERLPDKEPRLLMSTLQDLIDVHINLGHLARAESVFEKLIALWERNVAPGSLESSLHLEQAGDFYRFLGLRGSSWRTSEQFRTGGIGFTSSVAHRGTNRFPGDVYGERVLSTSSVHHVRNRKKLVTAEEYYRRVLSLRESGLAPDHNDRLRAVHKLAEILWAQKKYEEAEPLYAALVASIEKSAARETLADVLSQHADVLRHMKRKQEAEELQRRADDLRKKNN